MPYTAVTFKILHTDSLESVHITEYDEGAHLPAHSGVVSVLEPWSTSV